MTPFLSLTLESDPETATNICSWLRYDCDFEYTPARFRARHQRLCARGLFVNSRVPPISSHQGLKFSYRSLQTQTTTHQVRDPRTLPLKGTQTRSGTIIANTTAAEREPLTCRTAGLKFSFQDTPPSCDLCSTRALRGCYMKWSSS